MPPNAVSESVATRNRLHLKIAIYHWSGATRRAAGHSLLKYSWTQRVEDFAEEMAKRHPRTVHRWVDGELRIPAPMVRWVDDYIDRIEPLPELSNSDSG